MLAHGRVDLRVDVLEVHLQHRLPGFLQIDEGLLQHHPHHPQFGRGELAALDLGVAAVAAEEVVHQLEHQLGVEDEQRGDAQRLHLHQVEAGGNVQRVHVLPNFITCTPPTATSAERRSRLNMLMRV